ncbi:siphovirus ReqiPepy6 Gp37-like family protein [Bacillus sp. A301a_S52]|nr:siphovirus ReqiPepy6 Gp37-like family protein [Bacillus sp. A301a_S52]MCR6112691.1 siphovirus ReqiPepy6 Gp37-like family protein [Bacillus sp. A301a_S52]
MKPIRVFDPHLNMVDETDNYQSLQYERSFFSVGEIEIHINMHLQGAKSLEKGHLIMLDKQPHKGGIIQTKEVALDENGKASENVKLTGYTLDGLISRRVTVPPDHTSHDRRSGNAETVMKHYIMAHFVNPVDPARKMPFLEVAPNKGRGKHISWESRYRNVAEELETIGKLCNLGWTVYLDVTKRKLIFDVLEGKDLTEHNTEGNNPVFFSPDFSTVESQHFINSDNNLRNVGYVGGQGEGVERQIIQLGKTAGWDRIEEFIDARDIGDEEETEEEEDTQLIERGIQKMREMQTLLSFECDILTPITRVSYDRTSSGAVRENTIQETPFEYEKDFDLGDRVDVFNKSWGVRMKAPFVSIKEIYEPQGYKLQSVFGETRPTLTEKLNKKFNELNGVEIQELPSKVEVEVKGHANYLDEIIRDNLNLNSPLPEDVILSYEGVTGRKSGSDAYARLNNRGLDISGGAIRIRREDGAIYMQDGYVSNDYAISSYDPHFMTEGQMTGVPGRSGRFAAFFVADTYYQQDKGSLDGRGTPAIDSDDVRDSDHGYTVRFQRYEFVHAARFLMFTYQSAHNTRVGKHRVRIVEVDGPPNGYDSMFFDDIYEKGDTGIKNIVIDMGKPSYEVRRIDFRLGWNLSWGGATEIMRFKIPRVVQTDFP